MQAQIIAKKAIACVVYVSEGRRLHVLKKISQSIASNKNKNKNKNTDNKLDDDDDGDDDDDAKVQLVRTFVDRPYNRTGYTFAIRMNDCEYDLEEKGDLDFNDGQINALTRNVIDLARRAYESVGAFSEHSAKHPRVGIVDHISVHPIGKCTIDEATECADELSEALGRELNVNVYRYGGAKKEEFVAAPHYEGVSLAEIRRRLGYFKANGAGETWVGANDVYERMKEWERVSGHRPNFGSMRREDIERRGVCCVGAVPFVVNYNVPLFLDIDIDFDDDKNDKNDDEYYMELLTIGKKIAKRISERNEIDGLPNVQSMALSRKDDDDNDVKDVTRKFSKKKKSFEIEVACNLLDERTSTTREDVQTKIEQLVSEICVGTNVRVGAGYVTNLTSDDFLKAVSQKSSPSSIEEK